MDLRKLFAGYRPGRSPLNGDTPEAYDYSDYWPVKNQLREKGTDPSSAARQARKTVAFNSVLFQSGGPLTDAQAEAIAGVPTGRAAELRKLYAEKLEMKGAFFAMYGPLDRQELYLFIPGELTHDDNAGVLSQRFEGEWPNRRKRIYRHRGAVSALLSPGTRLAAILLELDAEGGRPIKDGERIHFRDFPWEF